MRTIPPDQGFAVEMTAAKSTTRTWQDQQMEKIANQPQLVLVEDQIIDGEARIVTVSFDTKKHPEQIELIHLTDLQYGSKGFKTKAFEKYIGWILEVPQRYVLLGGDLVDAATKASVGSPYENTTDVKNQMKECVEMLMPVQPRILGYVGGNHERRTDKDGSGFELGHQIAMWLKVPYSRGKQWIDINYGVHQPFKVALWHGKGAAGTKGSKVNMLYRFMQQGEAQMYLVGHLHDAFNIYDWREVRRVRPSGEKYMDLMKIGGAMSSSFLDHYGTYGEVLGCAPSDTMMARVIVYPKGGWEVTMR